MRYTITFMCKSVKFLARVARQLGELNVLEIVTPTNVEDEKKKWIELFDPETGGYVPCFKYNIPYLEEVADMESDFRSARTIIVDGVEPETPIDEAVKSILLRRIDEGIATCAIARGILSGHDDASVKAILSKYGRPAKETVDAAIGKVEGKPYPFAGQLAGTITAEEATQLKAIELDAKAIAEFFEEVVVDLYGIKGWRIVVDAEFTSIDVRDKSKNGPTVGVPVDRKVNGQKLLELIGHEINCHLRSTENARALWREVLGEDSPLDIFIPALAKSDDEMFYEGQAKMSDVRVNGDSALPLPYATIAISEALSGKSFVTVAKKIYECRIKAGQKEDAAIKGAWLTTYRAFRGIVNAENVNCYAFTKDFGYLEGYPIALRTDQILLQYASMRLEDIEELKAAGVDFSSPAYEEKGAVERVKNRLLAE